MKEEIEEQQEFLKLYELVGKDLTRFKKALEKTCLSPSQVKILWGYHAYRKRDQQKALEILKSVSVPSAFIEGARLYLLGLAYNHFGKFAFAREHLLLARDKFKQTNTDHFKLLNLATLLFCYSNQNMIAPQDEIMQELKKLQPANNYEKMLKILAKATYQSDKRDFKEANKTIELAFKQDSEYLPVFAAGFQLLKVSNFFSMGEESKCLEALEEYNKSTGFKCNSNYRFIKMLVDHILHNKVLYVYKYDFEDSQEQYDQLMVIKYLSEDNASDAIRHWDLLQKHNPELYLDSFNYSGDAVFFKLALEKNRASLEADIDLKHLNSLATIQEKLEYIWENGSEKIKKDRLIFLLWGEEDGPEERVKLRRALQYFQKKRDFQLKSFQDCYQKLKKIS